MIEQATGAAVRDACHRCACSTRSASPRPHRTSTPTSAGDHATGYTAFAYAEHRLPIGHVATGAMAPATGFSSTATDLVRWAAAHFLGDSRVLSDDAKRRMQRTEWPVEGAASSYGLGLAIAEPGGRRVLGHGGGFPGFITQTWFDPVERVAVAVLTNAIDGPAEPLATAAMRTVDLACRPPEDHPHERRRRRTLLRSLRQPLGRVRRRPTRRPPVPARPDGARSPRRATPPARRRRADPADHPRAGLSVPRRAAGVRLGRRRHGALAAWGQRGDVVPARRLPAGGRREPTGSPSERPIEPL